jgi:hypothetical protein
VQSTVGSGDPLPIDYANVFGTCCFNVFALLSSNKTWQKGFRDYIRSLWDCTKPMCFGHGYTWNNGTLGQVLASGDNSAELNRIAYPVNDVNFPWMLVVDAASSRACSVIANPELSLQGTARGLMPNCYRPETCTTPWSYQDQQALRAAGFCVYAPVAGGQGALTNAYMQNDVTNYLTDAAGRPNATFQDTNSRFLTAAMGIALAKQLQTMNGLALFTGNTKIKAGIKGTTVALELEKLVAWARGEVGALFSEFDNIQTDIVLKSDFEVARPCFGVPGQLRGYMKARPPVRIKGASFVVHPILIDNCVR